MSMPNRWLSADEYPSPFVPATRGRADPGAERPAHLQGGRSDSQSRHAGPGGGRMNAAIYARVSTVDQEPENQLAELRRYVEARGWAATEYVDRGVSGSKDRRPALDRLL